MVIILLSKGGRDYRGIGLQHPIWKITKVATGNSLKCLDLHDYIHGFTAHRGCRTIIMEGKAFDAMDPERCLKIPKDRGVDKNIILIIWMLLELCVMAC